MNRTIEGGDERNVGFVFRSTSNNNFEPRGMSGRVFQNFQEDWTLFIVTTFVECVNDKYESVFWVAREVAKEVKEEGVLHRLRRLIWVSPKTVCHDASKGGQDFGKSGDESRKDVSEIARIRVVPLAKKRSSEALIIVKLFTDRMS